MQIEDRIAFVTGSSRGLGRSLVEALLQRGARRVYAAARDPEVLPTLRALDPARVVPLQLDVVDAERVEAVAREVGEVDLVVNNAGTLASYSVLASEPTLVRRDVDVNVFGILHVARAFAPMLSARRGALANVLSVVSLASMPALAGYSASKAAAWSLTQALRAELGPRGVSVHAVFPGPIDTDMIRSFDVPKTSASEVARAILDGVVAGDADIAPDPMSRDVLATWRTDPRAIERRFAG